MSHDEMDVYQTVIGDTNEINRRRQGMDGLYVSLISLILTGDAYVAFVSRLDSWLDVAVTAGAGIVGLAVVARWRQALKDLDLILDNRYAFLRKLESLPSLLRIGATVYTEEYKNIYESRAARRFGSATKRLQTIFRSVFVIIPVALAALTAMHTVPWVSQLVPQIGGLILRFAGARGGST